MAKSYPCPKICFLVDGFPPVAGGLETHAFNLAEMLISKNIKLFVLTRRVETSLAKFEQVGKISVTRFPPSGWLQGGGLKALYLLPVLFVSVLYFLLRKIKYYNVILVSGFKVLSIPATLLGIFTKKKIIVKIESPAELWSDNHPQTMQKLNLSATMKIIRFFLLTLLRKIRNLLVKKVDCFVAISSEIREALIAIGVNPEKIHSIPNAINLDKFFPVSQQDKQRIRRKLFLPEEKIIFIFTGRLAISKGVLILIEVWNEIINKYKSVHLVYIGAGKYSYDSCEMELKHYLTDHKIENGVTLAGEVDNVDEYLKASDVFVSPSDYEGFSLALIEALACSLPVITTRVGAAGDIIKNYENGMLINPKDHYELKTAIEWMLENKNLWKEMGQKAHEGAKKYSLDTVANMYLEKIQQLL